MSDLRAEKRKQTLRHWSNISRFSTIETIHTLCWSEGLHANYCKLDGWLIMHSGTQKKQRFKDIYGESSWCIRSLIVLNKWSERCVFTSNRSNCRSHQEEEIMQLLSGDEEFVLQAQRCVFKQTNPCEGPFKSTMCLLSGFLSWNGSRRVCNGK